jgi:hypothetical protein
MQIMFDNNSLTCVSLSQIQSAFKILGFRLLHQIQDHGTKRRNRSKIPEIFLFNEASTDLAAHIEELFARPFDHLPLGLILMSDCSPNIQ